MDKQHLILAFLWILFCALHSVLASLWWKQLAHRLLGTGFRLYRLLYTLFAFFIAWVGALLPVATKFALSF